jgi:hypothetical protein
MGDRRGFETWRGEREGDIKQGRKQGKQVLADARVHTVKKEGGGGGTFC